MKNRNLIHKDEWATPKEFYDKLDNEFHFDFDPCPLKVSDITPENDGLLIEWGLHNFINPPYSRTLKDSFVKKAIEESKKGKLCVMLLPVSTSTSLFHDYIQPNADEIRFVRGRISFEGVNTYGSKVGAGSKPMHDSMIVIFDGRASKYTNKFKCFGHSIPIENGSSK
jgi:phage N-6-adenine-methyltransferase